MIPVVLSGGMGTRLWPLSRATFPKQFCELMDESLLEKTLKRVGKLGSPWTLTIRDLDDLTMRVFRNMQIPFEQIIFEPIGRNTAPAVALLCRILEIKGRQDEVAGVFPADHLVTNEAEFFKALEIAQEAALKGYVATLGIRPDHASTGFGYIETQSDIVLQKGDSCAHGVVGFREKPDQETAERFVAQGRFFWNAGIFVFQVRQMIENFKELMPDLWDVMALLKSDLSNLREVYLTAPAISIDYGLMEKLKAQVCIPCDIGWSDLGSWDDVARFDAPPGVTQLANKATVVESDTANCFVYSNQEKVYGLVDVEDVILVDTPDALLLARKGHSQNVRKVVEKLTKGRHVTAREHRFEVRPWGRFTILREEPHFKSKMIVMDPQGSLSYQSHQKRSEHWVIVRGVGEVTIDGKMRLVHPGESVFVPVGAKHRMCNPGPDPLEFIEVQTGSYFGEDDIMRYQDEYKRCQHRQSP